jgi:small-conductance mechanosensitive channel
MSVHQKVCSCITKFSWIIWRRSAENFVDITGLCDCHLKIKRFECQRQRELFWSKLTGGFKTVGTCGYVCWNWVRSLLKIIFSSVFTNYLTLDPHIWPTDIVTQTAVWLLILLHRQLCEGWYCYTDSCVTADIVTQTVVWLLILLHGQLCDCWYCYTDSCVTADIVTQTAVWLLILLHGQLCDCWYCYTDSCVTKINQ